MTARVGFVLTEVSAACACAWVGAFGWLGKFSLAGGAWPKRGAAPTVIVMARLLVATVPLTGHVHPMLMVVRELVARGHDVRWYAARKFRPEIEAAGARFAAMQAAHDWDDADVEAAIPALRGRRGISRVKAQLRGMFIASMVDQLRDLEALLDAQPADAIIADQAHLGAALVAEKRGVPWAGLGISALIISSVDTMPFGSGMPPMGRRGNRIFNWLILRALFADINRSYRRSRVAAGLPAGTGTYFDVLSPQLYLQPTIPELEYPRSDLPPHIHFIGPLVPREQPGAAALPGWWPDVEDAGSRGVPIVLVTQGTLATDTRELIQPSLRGLAGDNVLVVVTTGKLDALVQPSNARAAAYVPYQALLPRVAAMVTNGGYGGVQMAVRHGVPLVIAGGSEEKPEIAARLAWSGAAIDLRTGRPRPAAVKAAVRRVLGEPAFRDRAKALGAEMARYDAPSLAAELIEALVARRAPILRGERALAAGDDAA